MVDIEVDQASMKIHLQIEYNKLCALLHRSSIDQIVLKLSPESADRVVISESQIVGHIDRGSFKREALITQ